MEDAFVPYRDGYDFGMGVKSATGDRMQMGVKGTPTQVAGASGGSGSFQMTRIETSSDLEDHLGISADASGGIGLFSASDRFTFSRDCKIQTSSITLLLMCTQMNGFTQIDRPELDDAAALLVSQGQADLFAERYGDCFVSGFKSGGQFFGVIRIDVKSETDHQTVENSLSGSYGPFSGDVAAQVQTAMTQTQSTAETFLYYEGGNVQKKPQTPQDLFAAADEWSRTVITAPKPYVASLLPWVIANGPNPPNAADLDHQRDVLKSCANLRSQVLDRLNIIEYMTDALHAPEFVMGPNDPARLASLHAAISGDYDMISQAASFAITNAKGAVEPETFARTIKGIAGYTLAVLPPDLPKRVDGKSALLATPNFVGTPISAVLGIAATIPLHIEQRHTGVTSNINFIMFVQQQSPAPGTPIQPGNTVVVTLT